MPPPVREGSPFDARSIVESILDKVELAPEKRAEIAGLASEWKIIGSAQITSIQTRDDYTRILIRSVYEYQGGYEFATFLFPPNDVRFETELKRLHSEGLTFSIQYQQGRLSEDTQIFSIFVWGKT